MNSLGASVVWSQVAALGWSDRLGCHTQMVETHPYEALSHAVLAWLEQNQARCDVVHAHEWGGVFVDVITSVAYRQLKPGARPKLAKTLGLQASDHWPLQAAQQACILASSLQRAEAIMQTC